MQSCQHGGKVWVLWSPLCRSFPPFHLVLSQTDIPATNSFLSDLDTEADYKTKTSHVTEINTPLIAITDGAYSNEVRSSSLILSITRVY